MEHGTPRRAPRYGTRTSCKGALSGMVLRRHVARRCDGRRLGDCMPITATRFDEIRFGYASAEVEGAREPQLLLEGYYDSHGLIRQAAESDKFLFLGYKGSGKSAIGQRLRLLAEDDPQLFVSTVFLSDFPYSSFKKVAAGDIEPESRFPTAWAWLLLLRVIDSLRKDEGALTSKDPRFQRARKALEGMGLLPVSDLKQLVMTSSKQSFKAKIPSLLEAGFEAEFASQDTAMVQLVSYLKDIVFRFQSPNRHLLIIDGLDDILTQREVQYQSLAALILEVGRLSEDLARYGTPVKLVVLCRPDLFELLPGPNKNKIRRDSAVVLDWYHDTRNPNNSALVDLVNLRGSLAAGRRQDVFREYFPARVDGLPSAKAILDLTRHTPRDLVQLMCSIQKFAGGSDRADRRMLTRDQILNGMREYSIDYLFPEIKDELVGVGSPSEIAAIFSLISGMRSRDFKFDALRKAALQSGIPALESLDIERMLHGLYECSALGTVHEQGGYDAYTFKYRNRNSSLVCLID